MLCMNVLRLSQLPIHTGSAAGVVQTAVVSPVELLKIRQQLQALSPRDAGYIGPLQLLRRLLAAEGVRGEQKAMESSTIGRIARRLVARPNVFTY